MKKLFYVFSLMLLFLGVSFSTQADSVKKQYVVATASNDPMSNVLLVYSPKGKLLQSIPTGGMGGVPAFFNAGGIAKHGKFIAVINNLSSSVSIFKLNFGVFELQQVISTFSAPFSVAFGQGHLYVLGSTTVESHKIDKKGYVDEFADGLAQLLLGDGSAAQVGVLEDELIITESDNLIEFAKLHQGALTGVVTPLSAFPPPQGPLGLVTRRNTAYVSLFEVGLVALVKHNQLKTTTATGQIDPCWLALSGHWLFATAPISQTIARLKVEKNELILSEPVAAQTLGSGGDTVAQGNILAVLSQNIEGTQTYLSQYRIDKKGNLHLLNTIPTANNANGIAIASWPIIVGRQ